MSSCSELPLSDAYGAGYCRVLRSPRLLARVESPALLNGCVDMAHLEFLRITEVTERISESKMCLRDTEILSGAAPEVLDDAILNRGGGDGPCEGEKQVQVRLASVRLRRGNVSLAPTKAPIFVRIQSLCQTKRRIWTTRRFASYSRNSRVLSDPLPHSQGK